MKDLAVCKGYIVKLPNGDVHVFEQRDQAMQWINWYLSSTDADPPVKPSYTLHD